MTVDFTKDDLELMDGTPVEIETQPKPQDNTVAIRRKDGKSILPDQYGGHGNYFGYGVVYVYRDGTVEAAGNGGGASVQIVRNATPLLVPMTAKEWLEVSKIDKPDLTTLGKLGLILEDEVDIFLREIYSNSNDADFIKSVVQDYIDWKEKRNDEG